jgi:hypothetical protein
MAVNLVPVAVIGTLLAIAACQDGFERPSGQAQLDPEPVHRVEDAAVECDFVEAYVDADGDGHGVGAADGPLRLPVCDGGALPAGFTLQAGDCDDKDPGAFRHVCVDRDGDGADAFVCAGAEPPADRTPCPVVVEWTPEPGPYDCDDSDAQRIDSVYRDADGDGVGAGTAVCSLPGVGWSVYKGDCDDGDATRTPSKYDFFGDGLDSDCNGSDEGACMGVSRAEFARAPSARCDGPDLALGAINCSGCGHAAATLVVENRGATSVHADLQILTPEQESASIPYEGTFTVDLAPGERKALISGPFLGRYELRAETPSATDCSLHDNVYEVYAGHCI